MTDARPTLERQAFAELLGGSTSIRLQILPLPGDRDRYFAQVLGHGLVLLSQVSDGAARTSLSRLRQRLSSARPAFAELERTIEFLSSAAQQAGLKLRITRRALCGRAAAPATWSDCAAQPGTRPRDVEIEALTHGLREVVKLECVPPALVEAIVADARLPWVAVRSAPAGAATLLLARTHDQLDEARDLEERLLSTAGADERAARRMGALLGYPACCVERFGTCAARDDTSLAWALLPPAPHPPSAAATQWVHPHLALISHAPCSLRCEPSVRLGRALLDLLAARHPDFPAAWRRFSQRLQVVDHAGRRLGLILDRSPLESGARILDVVRLEPAALGQQVVELVGREIEVVDGGLVTSNAWYAPLVADHRLE